MLARLGERHGSPGVGVLLDGFAALREGSADGHRATAARLQEAGMPGVGNGLAALALAGLRLRQGEPPGKLPDAGPYAPWVRAWASSAWKQGPVGVLPVPCSQCQENRHRRLDLPDPPPGHVADALWVLAGRAGLAVGDTDLVARAVEALTPAAGEVAGANSGLLSFGPVADHLAVLAA
ncbi:hypothetical protein [Actinomycetospora sp. NBRC 106378]|uniref:hypothetical protein n=1 Tax=Actinomycetospora sp. NBRC 106378 TaxID=3032208 RepID=UPI0024A2C7EA|nr:hypothetical protein [Actinomycetospora sp. NBRC 106378]GLZ53262.1 hypothetical protein Acsp07_28790 [Actinomycetospora sp. NBRC 106378]